ncbi:hypothetical protein EAF04_008552 [Stromatinia cepivora]|nr:hypothetical protein EAF04_008552 [Stromatinia cepivora]
MNQSSATSSDRPPNKIFGQPIETFTLESTKHILAIFKKQGSIRKTSTLESLLPKLIDLESKVTFHERGAVALLLFHKQPITRAALSKAYDESGQEVFALGYRICQICYEDLPATMFRKGYAGYEVGEFSELCLYHGSHMVCTTCVTTHVAVQFESTHWDNITCPLCPGKLKMDTVLTYLSGEMLVNYKEYMSTYALRNLPGFCWCLSPSCRSGQVHLPGDESPKMTCQKCGFDTCYSHQLPWHDGKTCEEAGGLKSKEDRESEAWIKSQTKPCPNCGVATVKAGGCGGILCRCGVFWDWETDIIIG